jgi:DNA-binding transcriptional LysR family regulator
MRLNQLDGLLAFSKVAQHRSFSAAAAVLEVSPSALSQAIRQLEARLGVRLLNRTTRSVSLTEPGEAYLSRIGPALGEVLEAGEQLHALQGRPSGVLRINPSRISVAMTLQPLLAGFLAAHPDVQIEITNDEGYVDIVDKGFDAGIRLGESVQKDMVAVPLGGPVAVAVVGSPDYFSRHAIPRHPADLVDHNCVRFQFSGSGAIHKWELTVDNRIVEYEIGGSVTISDSLFSVEAALEGIGLAYTFEQLSLPHIRAKRSDEPDVKNENACSIRSLLSVWLAHQLAGRWLHSRLATTCRFPAPRKFGSIGDLDVWSVYYGIRLFAEMSIQADS